MPLPKKPLSNPTFTLLDALPAQDRQFLLERCQEKHYAKGETIFSRGDEGAWVLLIQKGSVEVSIMSLKGRKSIICLMGPDEMLGELSLLDRRRRSADAIARTEVQGVVIHSHTMQSFLKKNPDGCLFIIDTLCKRVRNASDIFEIQCLTNASARLARTLLRIGDQWGDTDSNGHVVIDQQLSQSDLGDYAGIARENANRYLKSWANDGFLSLDKGLIILLDRQQLMELAEL